MLCKCLLGSYSTDQLLEFLEHTIQLVSVVGLLIVTHQVSIQSANEIEHILPAPLVNSTHVALSRGEESLGWRQVEELSSNTILSLSFVQQKRKQRQHPY